MNMIILRIFSLRFPVLHNKNTGGKVLSETDRSQNGKDLTGQICNEGTQDRLNKYQWNSPGIGAVFLN
jgi:hypothetical protein